MNDQSTLVPILPIVGMLLGFLFRHAQRKRWFSQLAKSFEEVLSAPSAPAPAPVGVTGNGGGETAIIGQAVGISDYLVKLLDNVQKDRNALAFEISALKVSLDNEKRERAEDKVRFQAQLGEKDVEIGALRGELRKLQLEKADLEKRLDEQSKEFGDVVARLTARVAELEANQKQKGSEA